MIKKFVVLALAATYLSACTTTDPYTGEQKTSNMAGGAGIGAVAGALGGLVIGGGNKGRNALIGAGIGALAGGAVGGYMDNQEAELRQQLQGTGVSVTRQGDRIILNMPSNITFATDQSTVQPQFNQTLVSVALVLKKFDKSIVDVYGHTDSTGSAGHNLELSQRRAVSVATILSSQGVDQRRFFIEGKGPSSPIASNATEAGRAQNRRVEIQISPIRG